MKTAYVELQIGSETMRAYTANPDVAVRGGIIVFQEAFGVNAHIRDVAERFAKEGYLAIAPELFHRTTPGFEADYVKRKGVAEQMGALTDEGLIADATAAHRWLRDQGVAESNIAAVGYCMGGRTAYLANTGLPLGGAVSYYGGGISKVLEKAESMHAPMLLFWGGKDAHIPKKDIDAIAERFTALDKNFTNVVFSYADHGFSCDARESYNETAAKEAWALTLAYLQGRLEG